MANDGKFFFKRYKEYLKEHKFDEAMDAFNQAVSLEPDNIEFRLTRGELFYNRELYDEAIVDFTKVIELESDLDKLYEARHLRAISNMFTGDDLSVIDDLDWCIENGFDYTRNYKSRGVYHFRVGNYAQSISDLNKAVQKGGKTGAILIQRVQALYKLQRYDEAIEDLTWIIEYEDQRNYSAKIIYWWRGKVHYKLDKKEEALADFNQMMVVQGKKPLNDLEHYTAVGRPL